MHTLRDDSAVPSAQAREQKIVQRILGCKADMTALCGLDAIAAARAVQVRHTESRSRSNHGYRPHVWQRAVWTGDMQQLFRRDLHHRVSNRREIVQDRDCLESNC